MKKPLALILTLVMFTMAVSGCSSTDSKLQEIDERIARLESLLIEMQTKEETKEEPDKETKSEEEIESEEEAASETEVPTESETPETTQTAVVVNPTAQPTNPPTVAPTQPTVAPTQQAQPTDPPTQATEPPATTSREDLIQYSCLLEEKTVDEIASICYSFLSCFPQKGQTYDAYRASLPANSYSKEETNYRVFYCFTNPDVRYYYGYDYIRESIMSITIDGFRQEMDGTFGFYDTALTQNTVSLYLKDYDKAAAVYDKLFNLLSPAYNNDVGKKISDNRTSTNWSAYGPYVINTEQWYSVNQIMFLQMTKQEYGYYINATNIKASD